jgi:hypothetical protein
MTDLQFYLKCRLKREPTLFPGCWQKARDSRAIKKKKKVNQEHMQQPEYQHAKGYVKA